MIDYTRAENVILLWWKDPEYFNQSLLSVFAQYFKGNELPATFSLINGSLIQHFHSFKNYYKNSKGETYLHEAASNNNSAFLRAIFSESQTEVKLSSKNYSKKYIDKI